MMLKLRRTTIFTTTIVFIATVSCCCIVNTFGFQHAAAPVSVTFPSTSSRLLGVRNSRYHHHEQQQHRQKDYFRKNCAIGNKLALPSFPAAVTTTTATASSRLYASSSNDNMILQSCKDVIQRILLILMATFRQFISGFVTGYFFAMIWSLLRRGVRPSHKLGLVWGVDFGALSAIVTICDMVVANLFFSSSSSSSSSSSNNQQQKALSLSKLVIRTMVLSLYFGPNGGVANGFKAIMIIFFLFFGKPYLL